MKTKYLLIVVVALVGLMQTSAKPQAATQPSASSSSKSIEIRAQEEFNRANWGAALPLLTRVADQLRAAGKVDRLGAIEEQIRVCKKNLVASGAFDPSAPGAPPPSGEDRKPHAAPKAGETRDLTIQQLGNFEYDADVGGNIPDDVKALNGTAVKLRGFMIPMDQADSITEFALVPSLFACCFGQPPQVQHTIVVHLPEGKGVSYYPDEIFVEGKLIVDEKKEDGFIISVFEMDAQSVKPAAK